MNLETIKFETENNSISESCLTFFDVQRIATTSKLKYKKKFVQPKQDAEENQFAMNKMCNAHKINQIKTKQNKTNQ